MKTKHGLNHVVTGLAVFAGLTVILAVSARPATAQTPPEQPRSAPFMQQNGFQPAQYGAQRPVGPPRQFAQRQQTGRPQQNSFSNPQGRRTTNGHPLFVGPNRPDPQPQPQGQFDTQPSGYSANPQNSAMPSKPQEPVHSKFVVQLTDDNFRKQVLKSKKPVLVDIWAPWCGPCKAISPMIDEIAEEYAGQLKVGKLNLDECPEVAKAFNVEGLPTLLIFNRGELVDSILGAVEKENLEEALEQVLP